MTQICKEILYFDPHVCSIYLKIIPFFVRPPFSTIACPHSIDPASIRRQIHSHLSSNAHPFVVDHKFNHASIHCGLRVYSPSIHRRSSVHLPPIQRSSAIDPLLMVHPSATYHASVCHLLHLHHPPRLRCSQLNSPITNPVQRWLAMVERSFIFSSFFLSFFLFLSFASLQNHALTR